MDNREPIDIEALMIRAYFEKRIDKLGAGAANRAALGLARGPRAPGATFSAADKVDTSSYAARMAAEMREMFLRLSNAPDALLSAHDAVLALPDFFVEVGVDADFVVWDHDTAVRLGHRIDDDRDRPTISRVRKRRGADGAVTLAAVGAPRPVTRIVATTLVVVCGRECTRPAVSPVTVVRRRPVYRGACKQPVAYVTEYETPLDAVALDRAHYAVWHAALGMLRAAFAALPGLAVTGPSAPAVPWESAGRVLRGSLPVMLVDAPDAPAKPLPRKRKARVAGAEKVPVDVGKKLD